MNEQEFQTALEMLRSEDSLTYEEGYHWLLGAPVDIYYDELVALMRLEVDPNMRGKFIELLGSSSNINIVQVLESELSSPFQEVRFWAHSQLGYIELPEAQEIARKYKEENPSEDWY